MEKVEEATKFVVKVKEMPLHKSNFIKFLKNEGFKSFNGWGCSRSKSDILWINLNSKMYYYPSAYMGGAIGNHTITEEEFYSIYNIYKKYENLDPSRSSEVQNV